MKAGPTESAWSKSRRLKAPALELLREGKTRSVVASRLGLTSTTIGRWAKAAGIKPKRKPTAGIAWESARTAAEKYQAGYTSYQVAAQMGVQQSKVLQWLNALDVPRRVQGSPCTAQPEKPA